MVIPVRPSGYWAENGKLHVLWPQAWKGRTLDSQQRALFNTILHEAFFVGDFQNAELEWVDLREQTPGQGREVEVLPGEALGTVSHDDLVAYLDILIRAFDQFKAAKARRPAAQERSEIGDDLGTPLFDRPLPRHPSR